MFRKSRLHHPRRRGKKILATFLILLFVLVTVGFFFLYLPYREIRVKGEAVMNSAKKVKGSFTNNNIDEVKDRLVEVDKNYAAFKKSAARVYWAAPIPVFGGYIKDFRHGVEAGEDLIKASIITVDSIAPYADLIGFKKGATFYEKSADDRIQTAVLTLDKVLSHVDEIAILIDRANNNIAAINENHYPNEFAGKTIRPKIATLKEQFEGITSLFVDAKPFIKKFPKIMGTDKEKTYLILFQNDKELRATGGFLTAYAIFKIKDGKFKVEKSEDIYHLDESISNHPKAPDEILKYHKGVSKFNIRDSNLSPDFVKSIELFNSLYVKSGAKVEYDGIIAMDTHVLVDTLAILGDTEVNGITFSSKMDKRCDCPQVIYRLLDEIDRPVAYQKINRKGLLGDLLYAIMQKALGFSPSRYWGTLSQDFIKNLQHKHILVYLKDPETQKAIEAINFGGRIKKYDGDYLHINDVNFAGAKSNLFVEQEVVSNTQIKNDGTVERTITIEYKNPYPHSNCNLEDGGGLGRGGLCLNATLRNWLRVYVPAGSKLISFKGSEMPTRSYEDLGKQVFEGFLQVKPLGKASVSVTYSLPESFKSGNDYKLLIQKQPGTKDNKYTVTMNGKRRSVFELVEDKELKL